MTTTVVRSPHVLGHCYMCGLTILCGSCENNMCNGGRGNDGKCPDCASAAELLQQSFSVPVAYSKVLATREDIRAWQTRQLKQIPEMAGAEDPQWALEQVIETANCAFDHLVELERALREPRLQEAMPEPEYDEQEVAAAKARIDQTRTLLRWFNDHALLVQLITLAKNESDLLVALTALQVWMNANPRPPEECSQG